ncbi:uncharacterized protein N7496_002700 [Penicillium cataractarum]|uniref:Zn(2)-C6 fungal-type domain-containing protein n=1 Tax=Penicillium cataractarum TaxID=2100454 RepID=A0A9W9SKP8_9EURO|nr:uncharacterized protein N7496_002700 [Penicillium cataractarum]KAJ5380272.1 hypothetical protein N7496_002700 [Penicillium cataractarum]
MENLPPSAFAPGASQYNTALESSFQDSSVADNNHLADGAVAGDSNYVPRPKRIACVVCRRRKLRCDGKRPSCGTCSRLGHDCAYDEVRKKSGPKRGYVKQLEARLAQVETLLKGQETDPAPRTSPPQPIETSFNAPINDDSILGLPDISGIGNDIGGQMPPSTAGLGPAPSNPMLFPGPTAAPNDPSWDLISLGLEEPLPTQDVIDELDNLFFEKIYPMMPIIHRPRYYASLNLAPHMRPPICLRYIMWCHAASVSDKYYFLHHHFYQRARKYAEMDEMKGFGENIISLAHCQMWILTGSYEFRMIYFPRAWLSVGKASRLALMMGLHRLDGNGLDVKQSIMPPKDWTEREERRRTFWMAFCTDRYASIGTGWPMVIDENDIMTNLPASEESFLKSKPQRTLRLSDIIAGEGVSTLAPFACVCVLANLFGRNLVHIHRPQPLDNDHDLNGEFWKRHRSHDNILLHIALSLPEHLRLPSGMDDVNVIFANMSIHTSTICLHQAAIFKAEKNKMPNQIITESKRRCLVAANQISSIMKMVSHMDLSSLNPFMSFCLYISARVFVQYLKSRPDDSTVYSSLQFVVSALNAMKSKNPLTESFLVQLDVDLEGTGIRAMDNSKAGSGLSHVAKALQSYCAENTDCTPLYTVRQSQGNGIPTESPQDGSKSRTPSRPFAPGMTTSLPSRHRDSPIVDSERGPMGGESQQFFPHHVRTTNGIVEVAGGVIDGDMDFSPDFGLGERNPPSDHPTPSTLNSSSNTSYSMSGIDNPSPGKKQPNTTSTYPSSSSATSVDKAHSVQISPVTTESSHILDMGSIAGQAYPSSSAGPMGAAGAANVFNLSNRWDMPTPSQDLSNLDFENVNVEAFSDAQWAQILNTENGPGWENWRPS